MTAISESDLNQARLRSRKGEATRARLLQAAKEVFEADGFLDARVTDISERAELSHGSFYTYFESKEQIFREIALQIAEQMSAPVGGVILSPGSRATPHDRLHEAIGSYLEAYRREAKMMRVIEQVSRHDEPLRAARLEWRERTQQLVTDSIGRLQQHGLCDPRLDPVIASAIVGAMTERFPEMWFSEGLIDCSFEDGAEQLTVMVMNALGLRDRPAGRPPPR
ncbi:MAG: TetR/AcrR family transcriptional regulator [Acidimicrobiales bacterium]|jgi:AcrR family transcriptional regulator